MIALDDDIDRVRGHRASRPAARYLGSAAVRPTHALAALAVGRHGWLEFASVITTERAALG